MKKKNSIFPSEFVGSFQPCEVSLEMLALHRKECAMDHEFCTVLCNEGNIGQLVRLPHFVETAYDSSQLCVVRNLVQEVVGDGDVFVSTCVLPIAHIVRRMKFAVVLKSQKCLVTVLKFSLGNILIPSDDKNSWDKKLGCKYGLPFGRRQ